MRRLAISGLALLAAGGFARPGMAGVVGTLGNFDVVNNTGETAHGFEIDLQGLTSSDVTDTFGGAGRGFPTTVERYGAPVVSNTATGVSIVYQSAFTGGAWRVGTPSGVFSTPGESCWSGGGIGYGPATPCDHFGVGTSRTPTATTYKWLTAPPNSAALTPVAAMLPAPIMTVSLPVAGAPPAPAHVVAQVQAPAPPNPGEPQFGTPIWVKVFTTQYDKPVALEDLLAGNGIVPQSPGETEIEWQLLQTDPGNPMAGMLENQGDAGAGAESLLRRYEFYTYIGGADPQNGEVLSDIAIPSGAGTNIGAFIGDQNIALNLNGVFVAPLPAAVPEPVSLALFATGLIGFAGMRLSRSKSRVAARSPL